MQESVIGVSPGHKSILPLMNSIRADWENPKTAMRAIGDFLLETDFPGGNYTIAEVFETEVRGLGLEEPFVQTVVASVVDQKGKPIRNGRKLHEALTKLINETEEDGEDATVCLDTFSAIAETSIIPQEGIEDLREAISFKADTTNNTKSQFVIGSLLSLDAQEEQYAKDGQGESHQIPTGANGGDVNDHASV